MKVWLNKYIFLSMIMLLFMSCASDKKVYEVTSEELIAEFNKNLKNATKKYNNSIIIVRGKGSWIAYPKDGFFLNESEICLGGVGYDNKKRLGDHVTCLMKERESKNYIDCEIIIKGEFEDADFIKKELYIVLKNCKIEKMEKTAILNDE